LALTLSDIEEVCVVVAIGAMRRAHERGDEKDYSFCSGHSVQLPASFFWEAGDELEAA
jgi:hypothetical protein